jgi:hypothetical protein
MILCIFRENDWEEHTHCDQEAIYIYMAKSYCRKHMEIRSEENNRLRTEEEKRMEKLRKELES